MKRKIPKALREQVWISNAGNQFSIKCFTPWCKNIINAFDFHCGHKLAEANGGSTHITNLIPLCSRCNLSMGTKSYTEWISLSTPITSGSPVEYAKYTNNVAIVKTSSRRWCC
jgi:hypothetical protein